MLLMKQFGKQGAQPARFVFRGSTETWGSAGWVVGYVQEFLHQLHFFMLHSFNILFFNARFMFSTPYKEL